MQAGDDCLHHGSYALYESPQKKAKTDSKPDEKPLHRLLGQDEDHIETEEVLQGQSSEISLFVDQPPDAHTLNEPDTAETPLS
eukprot:gene26431-35083_t